jgi:hypothetical protein
MYVWYNNLLRYCGVEYNSSRPGAPFDDYKTDATEFPFCKFPFCTTLHALNSAIIKLSRTQRSERVFRGAAGGVLPAEFWKPNKQNVRGGIELAFMSTTTDRDIALHYGGAANASDKPSIIFEMQMGMIDRGAPVQWCSQFPEEAEILFAPLTGCEVVGMPKVEKSVIVIELRLNCNLHDLTIEQILAKMQKVGSFVPSLFVACAFTRGIVYLLCRPISICWILCARTSHSWDSRRKHTKPFVSTRRSWKVKAASGSMPPQTT